MKNDLTCAVVNDLLPSYADGLTGEETNLALERHLATCESCSAALERMRASAEAAPTAKDEKELAFLRKVKKKHLISAVCIAVAAALLAGIAFGGLAAARIYQARPVSYGDIEIVGLTVTNENGGRAALTGELLNGFAPAKGGKTVFDPATGRLTLTFPMRRALPWESRTVTAGFRTDGEIRSVYLDDVPLWENGAAIDETTALAFAAAHPYMGDITQNLNSAQALSLGRTFGPFTNEMTTSKTPYSWTLTFGNPVTTKNEAEIKTELTRSGILLLATIGNLDEVNFRYTVPDAAGAPAAREVRLTVAEADALTGRHVKQDGQTPSALQALALAYNRLSAESTLLQENGLTPQE